jgi:hypothetical protein
MRRVLIFTVFCLPLLIGLPPSAQTEPDSAKDTYIDISFDGVADEVRPNAHQGLPFHHELKITLTNRNEVIEQHTWGGGGYNESKKFGDKGRSTWHVLPRNELLGIEDYRQSIERVEIEIANTKCTVNVRDELKPGFTEYMFRPSPNSDWLYFSRHEVTSESCSIR